VFLLSVFLCPSKIAAIEHDSNYALIVVLLLGCIEEETCNSGYIMHELPALLV
jgi:hypothetical protein